MGTPPWCRWCRAAGDKAGLVDGDILEAIEGQDTADISLAMIRLMLEGAPGSTLTVGVVRSSRTEPDKISMTRSLTVNLRWARRCMRMRRSST